MDMESYWGTGIKGCVVPRKDRGKTTPSRRERKMWKGMTVEIKVTEHPPHIVQMMKDLVAAGYTVTGRNQGEPALSILPSAVGMTEAALLQARARHESGHVVCMPESNPQQLAKKERDWSRIVGFGLPGGKGVTTEIR